MPTAAQKKQDMAKLNKRTYHNLNTHLVLGLQQKYKDSYDPVPFSMQLVFKYANRIWAQ